MRFMGLRKATCSWLVQAMEIHLNPSYFTLFEPISSKFAHKQVSQPCRSQYVSSFARLLQVSWSNVKRQLEQIVEPKLSCDHARSPY
jgi:hypothetical protein